MMPGNRRKKFAGFYGVKILFSKNQGLQPFQSISQSSTLLGFGKALYSFNHHNGETMKSTAKLLKSFSSVFVLFIVLGCTSENEAPDIKTPTSTETPPVTEVQAVSATPSGKVSLALKLNKGQELKQEVTVTQKMVQTVFGQTQEVEHVTSYKLTQKVEDLDSNGIMNVNVTYDSLSTHSKSVMGEVKYNSDDPPENIPPQMLALATLVGKRYSMKIDNSGHILEFSGLKELVDSVVEKLPGGPIRPMAERQVRQQFGETGVRDMMEPVMAVYPDNPVGVGDSWDKSVVIMGSFSNKQDNTFRLTSLEGGVVTLDFDSKVTPNEEAKAMEMSGIKMKMVLEGHQKGTFKLDEKSGLVTGVDLQQNLTGKMVTEGGPMGKMEVPMSINGTVKMLVK